MIGRTAMPWATAITGWTGWLRLAETEPLSSPRGFAAAPASWPATVTTIWGTWPERNPVRLGRAGGEGVETQQLLTNLMRALGSAPRQRRRIRNAKRGRMVATAGLPPFARGPYGRCFCLMDGRRKKSRGGDAVEARLASPTGPTGRWRRGTRPRAGRPPSLATSTKNRAAAWRSACRVEAWCSGTWRARPGTTGSSRWS